MSYVEQLWKDENAKAIHWDFYLNAMTCKKCGTQLIPAAGSEWFPCSTCVLKGSEK
jgi:hypothetical protein